MAWKALALLLVLAGCQSTQARLDAASSAKARADVRIERPVTPSACITTMGRVKPKEGDRWVHLQKRWEIAADARDRQAADCGEILDRYWKTLGAQDADTEAQP